MKSEIVEVKISDLGEIITGNTPPTSDRTLYDGEYPLIMPTDIIEGNKVIHHTEETVSEKGFKKYKKSLIPANMPCVVTIGSIGKKLCLTKVDSFTNQAINAVIVYLDKYDPDFVFYLMKYNLPQVKNLSSGTASGRENVSKSSFSKIKVKLPKYLSTQKKIASILSAYDDLIENNNQRIKLLEEMSEEIYKEWFVRFRFPGYKDATFLDKEGNKIAHGTKGAVPEGWEKKPLDEFESFSKSDSKLRKFEGEKRYLATADITDIKISGEGEIITWDNKPSRAQLKPELHSVFFARMSNTYKVLNFTDSNSEFIEELALTSGFLGLKAKNKQCFAYLFSFIKGENFHNYKDVYANGATQVSLTNEGFHMIRLYEPTLNLIEKYSQTVNPFFDEINILMKKNQILQDTRDLLLPRLISGKLSVENLEIEESLNMAAESKTN